jgi:hypothetical protein
VITSTIFNIMAPTQTTAGRYPGEQLPKEAVRRPGGNKVAESMARFAITIAVSTLQGLYPLEMLTIIV